MSHKVMNRVITYEYNFENEDIVNYYIAFLKSLTMRLDAESIKLFFNEVSIYLIGRDSTNSLCTRRQ